MKWLMRLFRRHRDNIRVSDEVIIEHIRGGKVIEKRVLKGNIITNAGKAAVAARAGAIEQDGFTYLAVGTGVTAENATQTALVAEITTGGLARAAATVTRVTTTVANDTLQLVYTWTASAAHAVRELGTFNAAAAGDMLARKLFAVINVANTDQLKMTHKFPITAA